MRCFRLRAGWGAGLVLGGAIAGAAFAASPPRPNFLIILADDLGYGDLSCYGNERIRTPHLDALAAEGVRFTDFHASGPVCSPTRAGLMTGRYQQRAGVTGVIRADFTHNRHHGLQSCETTLAELLGPAGYATAVFGKWHLGYERAYNPLRQGFDQFRGYVSGNVDYQSHYDRMEILDWWDGVEIRDEPGYTTHLITRHAIEFLEAPRAKPFCLYLPFEPPHAPYQGPNDPPQRGPDKVRGKRIPAQVARAYREMVEEMDRGVGEIIATLRRLNLATNTFVFFFSDNGANKQGNNGPLRGFKGSLWEGGQREPAIAWWPGHIRPGVTKQTAISLDVLPTLLDLAGLPAPRKRPLDGVSLAPLLLRGEPLPARRLFWEFNRQAAVREGPWKLLVERTSGDREIVRLFNLDEDLGEARNLADRFPERTRTLRTALAEWREEVQRKATPQPEHPAGAVREPGYRGIWFTLGQRSQYGDKYSGGLGTYTAKHIPLAVYDSVARKTFFVYGGAPAGTRHLLAMAGAYDHHARRLEQPVVVHDKGGVNDPHDNPSLALAADGRLWVFVSGRGRHRPGYVYRSKKPHALGEFERILEWEMTYPQPWVLPDGDFLLLFTRYTRGRELYFSRSRHGFAWSPPVKLAGMGGHYQVSNQRNGRVITAFSRHPGGNVDRRTDLYFAQTDDAGQTWQTVDGQMLTLPLTDPATPARVRNFSAEHRLVYLKDINFDARGRPLILLITAADYRPGPPGDPRFWTVAHWDGTAWRFHRITPAGHNYDMGSIYLLPDGAWRVLAPTEPGPQRYGAGGEVALWESRDAGASWQKLRQLTRHSRYNHNYVRRVVHAAPDFAAFWADGNPDAFSPSRLYFTDRDGAHVWRMPETMSQPTAAPRPVFAR